MPKVFLSHCSKDKSFVRSLANRLNAAGIDVYNYPQKLDSELRCKLESAIARKEAWSDAEHA